MSGRNNNFMNQPVVSHDNIPDVDDGDDRVNLLSGNFAQQPSSTQTTTRRRMKRKNSYDGHGDEREQQQQLDLNVRKGSWVGETLFGNMQLAIRYVTRDTKHRLFGFLIGLLTIVIVVFVVSLLYNGILKASIVFVKLAEDQIGETDFIYYTKFSNSSVNPFVNETDMNLKLSNHPRIVGTSPRWILPANVQNTKHPSQNTSAMLLIVDTDREEQMGLGRTWSHRPLGHGEAHVRDSILRAIGVRADRGESINIQLSLTGLQAALSGQDQAISQNVNLDFDPDDPSAPDDGGDSPSITDGITLDPAAIIRAILSQSGFDFKKVHTVNLTELVDRMEKGGVEVPPIIEVLARSVGSVNFTGEQLFSVFLQNGTSPFFSTDGLTTEYKVIDAVSSPAGKYPTALGNIIMVDSRFILRAVGDSLLDNPTFKLLLQLYGSLDQFNDFVDTFNINQYSLSVVGMFSGRFDTYMKKQKERNKEIILFSDEMRNILGVDYSASVQFPLLTTLDGLEFIILFLDQLFVGVVVMLGILGVILIFALLLASVEEKTYEYGMLRALGLQKHSLMQIIITQALYFAVPGVILGMMGSFFANIIVEYIIRDVVVNADYKIRVMLDTFAIIIPIAIGLAIPVIANVVPIRNALSKTLRDSLDIAHQSFNETTVKMIRLEKLGIEPWQTGISVSLVVAGFVVYYLIPYSFIFQRLPMFFAILNCILLAMLFGLCMISVVFQPALEGIILNLIVWGPDRKMKTLIAKNLAGHRKRSRKTFMMFTLAIAFVIFAGVAFSLQVSSIRSNIESFIGADALLKSSTSSYPLPEKELNSYLDSMIAKGEVHNYCYQSFSVGRQDFITRSRLGSLSYFRTKNVEVYAVSQNYLEVAYSKYFLYSAIDPEFTYKQVNGKPDVINSLYVNAGQAVVDGERSGFVPKRSVTGARIDMFDNATSSFDPSVRYKDYVDVIVSTALKPAVSIERSSPLQLKLFAKNPTTKKTTSISFVAKARAMVYKFPGYLYSSYEPTAFLTAVLISTDSYLKLINASVIAAGIDQKELQIPKEKLMVKFKTSNQTKVLDIMNELKSLTTADFVTIASAGDLLAGTKRTTTALLAFFNVVAAIAVTLCFFILTLSFTANVRDNSWEFGVLRAVGMSVSQLIRAYIYEALCLVISAFICGTTTGMTIALTLTAQFNIFLETPFEFAFPYWLVGSLAAMALVVAVLGSYIPARVLRKKDIALVLKGVD